jgi:hypothetical protein
MAAVSNRLGYQCCFCGQSILEQVNDPVIIAITLPGGGAQQLYSHAACLKTRLDPSVPVALFDEDLK